ncbi:MAG: D-alanyl-D-alanine carboxypeptidase [Clostridia bacterium]|nr:D-alanyl-D-alanine carboxypeptidase [Clostridia bacterium]
MQNDYKQAPRRASPNARAAAALAKIKAQNKRRKRNSIIAGVIFGAIVIITLCAVLLAPRSSSATESIGISEKTANSATVQTISADEYTDRISDGYYSNNILLVDLTNKKILAEKDGAKIAYPASLTKIMTLIVALENCGDYEATFSLDRDMADYLFIENASVVGYSVGEKMNFDDMLYGTMLASGADTALGLANTVAGSEENFVALMNLECEKLGLSNTHFSNVTGLHDKDHYTTAYDMAHLLEYALKNEKFYQIFTTTQYTTSKTKEHPDGMRINATWAISYNKANLDRGYVVGAKTGFTDEAAQCLASVAKKDGNTYVLITLGAGGGYRDQMYHVLDTAKIYDTYLQ